MNSLPVDEMHWHGPEVCGQRWGLALAMTPAPALAERVSRTSRLHLPHNDNVLRRVLVYFCMNDWQSCSQNSLDII